MAVCEIWDVKGRLDHPIDYAENPEKTANPKYICLLFPNPFGDSEFSYAGIFRGGSNYRDCLQISKMTGRWYIFLL